MSHPRPSVAPLPPLSLAQITWLPFLFFSLGTHTFTQMRRCAVQRENLLTGAECNSAAASASACSSYIARG